MGLVNSYGHAYLDFHWCFSACRSIAMSDIKHAFVSRFKNGVIVESDFSQLEVVGLAALSEDPALIDDLLSGRDMHTYYTAKRLNIPEEEVQAKDRKYTKKMTFQLQYGSGAANMARKLGMKQDDCQVFIDTYYTRYSRTKEWQDENIQAVKDSREPSERRSASGQPIDRGTLQSPSGRIYAFYEGDPPDWMRNRNPTFQPTQIKNYPVQGFATGDIMAVFRARVLRWWINQEDKAFYLPVNTVHDSVVFDCYNRKYALLVAKAMKDIAEALVEDIENLWGITCPVPFKVESKGGPSWGNMRTL